MKIIELIIILNIHSNLLSRSKLLISLWYNYFLGSCAIGDFSYFSTKWSWLIMVLRNAVNAIKEIYNSVTNI